MGQFRFRHLPVALASLLLLFTSLHRFIFEFYPEQFKDHWTEWPITFLVLAIFASIPIQFIILLASIKKNKRHQFLPNLSALLLSLFLLILSALLIDPIFLLYAT